MAVSSNPGQRFFLGIFLTVLAVIVWLHIEPAFSQDLERSPVEIGPEAGGRRLLGTPPRSPQFHTMAEGQSPHSLFITCSDSRLVPSLIARSGIGELFVIRNAGNIVPPFDTRPEGVTATIEYAVAVLEVPKIIVCGHTLCGAMKAALEPMDLDTVRNVKSWIQFVEPARLAVDELHPNLGPDARWIELVKQNVRQQLANLKTHPWVAARTATGRLQLEGWVYGLQDRQVLRLPMQ